MRRAPLILVETPAEPRPAVDVSGATADVAGAAIDVAEAAVDVSGAALKTLKRASGLRQLLYTGLVETPAEPRPAVDVVVAAADETPQNQGQL